MNPDPETQAKESKQESKPGKQQCKGLPEGLQIIQIEQEGSKDDAEIWRAGEQKRARL